MHKIYGPKKLLNIMDKVTKPLAEQHGYINFKIVANWQRIVGNRIANICSPLFIKFPNQQQVHGLLILGVQNPSFSLEIQANSNILLEKLATHFGYRALDRIAIKIIPRKTMKPNKVTSSSAKPLTNLKLLQALAKVEDEETKILLEKIIKHIIYK